MYAYIKIISKYYQKKNKEKLPKEVRERDQNLSEEKKEKRPKKACDRYKNLFEEEKEKRKRQDHQDLNCKNIFKHMRNSF